MRQMTVTANSREQWDIWKLSKRVTELYPLLTNLNQIITDVSINVGLDPDEIIIPPTSLYTVHSNTQLVNVSAWEMVQAVCTGMGVTPLINSLGQLTAISRDVQFPIPNYTLATNQVVKVTASRHRPSTTRYVLTWSDPNLTQILQPQRLLAQATVAANIFAPYMYHDVYFSQDKTQRATETTMITKVDANRLFGWPGLGDMVQQYWHVDTDTKGRIEVVNVVWPLLLTAAWVTITTLGFLPNPVITAVFGGVEQPVSAGAAFALACATMGLMMSVGPGDYEIWGNPYDWGHAKNTSEAYDVSAVAWLDNPQTEECDFIVNEAHAQATCTRELIYLSKSANTWSAVINEDFRMERGDMIAFPDGSCMYVLDFTRDLARDSTNQLNVSGFLI
jgi:hypothetical protein